MKPTRIEAGEYEGIYSPMSKRLDVFKIEYLKPDYVNRIHADKDDGDIPVPYMIETKKFNTFTSAVRYMEAFKEEKAA